MNSRFPISLSIQWHHMERKVLKRQEDEDKFVNFIGRPFGYITPTKLLPTHSYQKTNSLIFLSFFCLLLYSAICTMGWCYRLTSNKVKLGGNIPSSNKVYFWCP